MIAMLDPNWVDDGIANGWTMPKAAWWKRVFLIRHVRAGFHTLRVARYEAYWRAQGLMVSGYDSWVLYGIAHGQERPNKKGE